MGFGGGGGLGHFMLSGDQQTAYSSNQVNFTSIDIGQANSTTETSIDINLGISFTIHRILYFFRGNSKDGDTINKFRVNGVTVGSITVGAGLLGQFSIDVDELVLPDALVNWSKDTTDSTSGSMNWGAIAVCHG